MVVVIIDDRMSQPVVMVTHRWTVTMAGVNLMSSQLNWK